MSTGCLDVVVEQPVTLGKEIWSWKHSESSSLLAQKYAAALMRVTVGGFLGLLGEQISEVLEVDPEHSEGVPMMEMSWQRVRSQIHAVMVARKRCCPIPSQSRDCSR